MRRTWDMAEQMNSNRPPMGRPELAPEWLVEIAPINDPELPIIEAVQARDEWEAVWFAFQRRNIPNQWVVTAVERC